MDRNKGVLEENVCGFKAKNNPKAFFKTLKPFLSTKGCTEDEEINLNVKGPKESCGSTGREFRYVSRRYWRYDCRA